MPRFQRPGTRARSAICAPRGSKRTRSARCGCFTGDQHLNHWVDISETLDRKVQALEAHASQLGECAATGALRREMLKWAEAAGKRSQLGFRYAEGFQRIVLMSDEEKPPEAETTEADAPAQV
jgi:hypothetical protein